MRNFGFIRRGSRDLLLFVLAGALQCAAAPRWGASAAIPLQEQSGQPAQAAKPDQADSSADSGTDLDDQVIKDVFDPLQRGIQGLNPDQVLALFDKDEMPDYAQVRDQVRTFFNRYQSINVRYQLLQVTSQKDSSSAVVEIQMDAVPVDESLVPLRRDVQLRFEMKLGSAGWKVTGFRPSDFFTQ